jgi:hypothetical protein
MTYSQFFSKRLLMTLALTLSLPAFARVPIRQSSDNGASNGVDQWTLLGRGTPITLTANGKKAIVTRQVICPTQVHVDGSCTGINGGTTGDYLWLFQVQSTSANVSVNIGKLQGFVKQDGDHASGTYGVMFCDDNNDQELCTTDPNDPGFTQISNITFKVNSKNGSSVSFVIPTFPSFGPGSTPQEGQGLTFYVQTHQNNALPLAYPSIGIN